MPDIGVLEITIEDNSKKAATGLNSLAKAISALGAQSNQELNLGNIANQVKAMATSIADQKGAGTIVKNMGTLFNAVTKFSQLKKPLEIATEPFERLKNVIGSGFNIGTAGTQLNQIREALTGNWGDPTTMKTVSETVATSMKNIAAGAQAIAGANAVKTMQDTASALDLLAKAITNYSSAVSAANLGSKKLGDNWRDTMSQTAESVKAATSSASLSNYQPKSMATMSSSMFGQKFGQHFYALNDPDSGYGKVTSGLKDVASSATETSSKVNAALKEVDSGAVSNIQTLTAALKDINQISGAGNELKSLAEGLKAIAAATKNADANADAIRTDANALNRMKTVCTGFAFPDFSPLITLAQAMQANPMSGVNIKRIADGLEALNAIKNFNSSNKGSYAAINMIGTALKHLGEKTAGFKLPSFTKLIELTDALQRNFLSSVELERIATAMEHIKAASNGFKMPKLTGLENAMASPGTAGNVAESAQDAGVTSAMEHIQEVADETAGKIEQIPGETQSSLEDVAAGVKNIGGAFNDTNQAIERGTGSWMRMQKVGTGPNAKLEWVKVDPEAENAKLEAMYDKIEATKAKREERLRTMFENSSQEKKDWVDQTYGKPIFGGAAGNVSQATEQGMEQVKGEMESVTEEATSNTQELRNSLEEVNQELQNDTGARSIEEIGEQAKKANPAIVALKSAFAGLKKMINNLGFVKLSKQMVRMAKTRALRYAIRELAKGFREGTENVYRYSDAIGGSFAADMDNAATTLNQMKNAIGAAAAPLIQSLIPIFEKLTNIIMNAANWLNQFISLLQGKNSWTKALPVATKAFDDQKKSAKGASDAVKDMLADFDELNIIQQNSSGSGSGSSGSSTNYSEMFEEESEFDSKIVDIVNWIKDNMETVLGIVSAIRVAIWAWRVSNSFEGFIGKLGAIVAGGAIMAIGWQLVYEGAYAAGLNGEFSTESLIASIGGGIASAIGGGLIGFKLGGTTGAVIGAITGLAVSAAIMIKAYYKGKAEAEEIARWGDIHLDAEEIKEKVQAMYSFDIEARIELIGGKVENMAKAKKQVNADVFALGMQIDKIKLSADIINNETELLKLKEQCDALIASLNEMINADEEGLVVLFNNIKLYDSNGHDITNDILASLRANDQTITGYMEDLGKRMAESMYAGQQSGWANGEAEQMLALAERQQNIVSGAEKLQLEYEIQQAKEDIWGGTDFDQLDKQSAMELMRRVGEYENQYAGQLRELFVQEKKSWNYRAGIAANELKDLEENWQTDGLTKQQYEEQKKNLENARDYYYGLANDITEEFINEQIEEILGSEGVKKEIKRKMTNTFRGNYGNAYEFDIGDLLYESLMSNDDSPFFGTSEGATRFARMFIRGNTPAEMADAIDNLILKALPSEAQDALASFRDDLGGKFFAMLDPEAQRHIFAAISLKSAQLFDSAEEQRKFVDQTMSYLFGNDAGEYARFMLNNVDEGEFKRIVSESNVKITDYIGMVGSMPTDEMKLEFMRALQETYGYDTVKEAFSKLDVASSIEDFISFASVDLNGASGSARSMYLRYLEDLFGKEAIQQYIEKTYGSESATNWMTEMDMSRDLIEYGMNEQAFKEKYAEVLDYFTDFIREYTDWIENNNEYKGTRFNKSQLHAGGFAISDVGPRGYSGYKISTSETTEDTLQSFEDSLSEFIEGFNNGIINMATDVELDASQLAPAVPSWVGNESPMYAQPGSVSEDTNNDARTANATEATSAGIVDQNGKIDTLTILLRAVLNRLNGGLNVNMAPTSAMGQGVLNGIAAFGRVTGDN